MTSFFNLEFNVPLKPMERVAHEDRSMLFGHKLWDAAITREEIEKELMEKFKEFPGVNFNFSQYDSRQRRGGPLGREGGQLGQALRHRPE